MLVNREPNGDVLRSKKDWMAALNTRSSRRTNEAIAAALASGLVGRRRTASPTLEGGRPSFLYGLKCLPTESAARTRYTKAFWGGPKRGPKPSREGLNPSGAIDIVQGACAVVYDLAGARASAAANAGLADREADGRTKVRRGAKPQENHHQQSSHRKSRRAEPAPCRRYECTKAGECLTAACPFFGWRKNRDQHQL